MTKDKLGFLHGGFELESFDVAAGVGNTINDNCYQLTYDETNHNCHTDCGCGGSKCSGGLW